MSLDKIEIKIRRIDEELVNARAKADELKTKIISLEKERENAENLRIVLIVRNTEITPETLKQLLSMQQTTAIAPAAVLPGIIKPEKIEKERKSDEID